MPTPTPLRRLRAVPDAAHRPPCDTTSAADAGPRATAVQFSESVRLVVGLARRGGLRPPVFRSPPTLPEVDRTIRRSTSGSVVVAVRRDGRPLAAVQADVIEGVVAANGLSGHRADRFRHAAWAELDGRPASAGPPRRRSERGERADRPARRVA